jgi:hypothetical protein
MLPVRRSACDDAAHVGMTLGGEQLNAVAWFDVEYGAAHLPLACAALAGAIAATPSTAAAPVALTQTPRSHPTFPIVIAPRSDPCVPKRERTRRAEPLAPLPAPPVRPGLEDHHNDEATR